MGGWGKCPCRKAGGDLTEHHGKDVGKKFRLCRECHNVLEEYIRLVGDYKNAGPVQGPQSSAAAAAADRALRRIVPCSTQAQGLVRCRQPLPARQCRNAPNPAPAAQCGPSRT